jgi:L-aspartate oxidase
MKSPRGEVDYVVVGAGIAGLRAAIGLADAGRVLVLAKKEITESATQYAQGGIAAALSDEDEIGLHLQDTLNAGDGLCNVEAAKILVEEGPTRIEELIAWGTEFDRSGSKLAFTREGAHSRNRVLHAQGDSTGREIGRALYLKASALKNVTIMEFELATDLVISDGEVRGLVVMNDKGERHTIDASAVLLATGGLGQVYRETTNPGVATGDGVAMAFRAGAAISDMEFVQFHPTALYVKNAPRFLLSEALRGEGAVLRNMEMARFMPKYHPDLAELAPRDVVARAIAHEIEVVKSPNAVVYLDMTHLNAKKIRERFPRIYETCLKYNVDITDEMIPIRPAAHYAMGGVRTDLDGHTTLKRLFAAGEAACTGVHGANRLASNSLLEGLVFGARAGCAMRELSHRKHSREAATAEAQPTFSPAAGQLAQQIREITWTNLGIVRSTSHMKHALAELKKVGEALPLQCNRAACEIANMHLVATLIARSALAREESRGAHYRFDYPQHNDVKFAKHSVIEGEKIRFEPAVTASASV